jgi:2-polyprenyl-6-hydroxyphenyl methylase/3-demethylubiquinone-9 3-methyltransferase
MWQALDNAGRAVKANGQFFIALYNDQGWISTYWHIVKRTYVSVPRFVRLLMLLMFWTYFGLGLFVADLLRLRSPLKRHTGDARGMKFFTDVIDWVGGYPFEVATPARVEEYLRARGFALTWQHVVGHRHGCNEFVFRRVSPHG